MSAENMSENMSTDLPDILCHNNPDRTLHNTYIFNPNRSVIIKRLFIVIVNIS